MFNQFMSNVKSTFTVNNKAFTDSVSLAQIETSFPLDTTTVTIMFDLPTADEKTLNNIKALFLRMQNLAMPDMWLDWTTDTLAKFTLTEVTDFDSLLNQYQLLVAMIADASTRKLSIKIDTDLPAERPDDFMNFFDKLKTLNMPQSIRTYFASYHRVNKTSSTPLTEAQILEADAMLAMHLESFKKYMEV